METQRIPAICGLWIIELNSSSCSDLQSEKEFHLLIVVLFSHSVVSASLRSRGLQHAGLPCPSPSPGVCPSSCPLSGWCHRPSHPLQPSSLLLLLFFHLPERESERASRSLMSDTLQPHGLYTPWKPPGQNTGVDSLSLLQGSFPTQGSNPGLPHCRGYLHQLSHKGSSRIQESTSLNLFKSPKDCWVGITVVVCHFLLQGIFPTKGLNPHLLHWEADSEPPGKPPNLFKFHKNCWVGIIIIL